jgi:hypothetical protein
MDFAGSPVVIKKHWLQILFPAVRVTAFGFCLSLFVFSILGARPASADEEMSFRIVSLGSAVQVIAAEGQITDATPQIFRAFLHEHSDSGNLRSIVLIDSYGGKVLASMELGRIFRQIGAAVIVAQPASGVLAGGRCFSACVYALMGGKKRVIPPQSQAGIHRMVAYGGGYDSQFSGGEPTMRLDNGTVAASLSRYSASMGVNPAIISLAEHIPPGLLHVLSRGEIARWHLAVSQL